MLAQRLQQQVRQQASKAGRPSRAGEFHKYQEMAGRAETCNALLHHLPLSIVAGNDGHTLCFLLTHLAQSVQVSRSAKLQLVEEAHPAQSLVEGVACTAQYSAAQHDAAAKEVLTKCKPVWLTG